MADDDEMEGSGRQSAEGTPAPGLVAWVLGVLAAFAGGIYLQRCPPLVHYSADARLDRAARAVVSVTPAPREVVTVQSAQGVLTVPLGLEFDRLRAVRLALALEVARRRVVGDLLTEPATEAVTAPVYAAAEELVSEFLAVEKDRACLLLCAFGWPWPPEGRREAAARDSYAAPPEAPSGLLAEARSFPTWPQAEESLKNAYGLDAAQLSALRARLCREAVAQAFTSDDGAGPARAALAKYADLVPAQAETALAMAGALELVRQGPKAAETLEAMAKGRPDLAVALLRAVAEEALAGAEGGAHE
jgi:hypothetical protein